MNRKEFSAWVREAVREAMLDGKRDIAAGWMEDYDISRDWFRRLCKDLGTEMPVAFFPQPQGAPTHGTADNVEEALPALKRHLRSISGYMRKVSDLVRNVPGLADAEREAWLELLEGQQGDVKALLSMLDDFGSSNGG